MKKKGTEGIWMQLRKIADSDAFQLIVSVLAAVAVFFLETLEINSKVFFEACVGAFITYNVIYMLRNPYGKLQEKFSTEHRNQEEIFNSINGSICKLEGMLVNIQQTSIRNLDEKEKVSDKMLSVLVSYLSTEAYGECTERTGNCNKCSRYQKDCSGLLRSYLHEDCDKLAYSMETAKQYQKYKLNTDISYYHTLAIEQLIKMEGQYYRVIQPLLDKNGPVFDKMDIDFTHIFLQRLKENDYAKKKGFKVEWIFVGKHEGQIPKNNYSYLIDELEHLENQKIKDIFEFRTISSKSYAQLRESFKKIENTNIQEYFTQYPSLGIFDEIFVFVDAGVDVDEHGIMYTNQGEVRNLITFYNKLWNSCDIKKTTLEDLVTYIKSSQ